MLVHLPSDEYDVAAPEGQFPRRLTDKIVKGPRHQARLGRLILGSASLTQIVHEVVVAIQRYGRLLRRSAIAGFVLERFPRVAQPRLSFCLFRANSTSLRRRSRRLLSVARARARARNLGETGNGNLDTEEEFCPPDISLQFSMNGTADRYTSRRDAREMILLEESDGISNSRLPYVVGAATEKLSILLTVTKIFRTTTSFLSGREKEKETSMKPVSVVLSARTITLSL